MSKQVVWLPVALVAGLAAYFLLVVEPMLAGGLQRRFEWESVSTFAGFTTPAQRWMRFSSPDGLIGRDSGMVGAAFAIVAAYGVGQLASMSRWRPVTAALVGSWIALAAVGWIAAMHALKVPYSFSVAPLPIALLAATYLYARTHSPRIRSARARLSACGMILLTVLGMFLATAVWRVNEVPADTSSLPQFARGDSRAFGPDWRSHVDRRGWKRAAEPPRASTELAYNRSNETISRSRAAGPMCGAAERLAAVLIESAKADEAGGRLENALDGYVRSLELANALANDGGWEAWLAADRVNDQTSRHLVAWAMRPGQTLDQVAEAIKRITETRAQYPSLAIPLRAEYLMLRRELVDRAKRTVRTPVGHNAPVGRSIAHLCPWEHSRAVRVFDALMARNFAHLDQLDSCIANALPLAPMMQRWWEPTLDTASDRSTSDWLITTPLLDGYAFPTFRFEIRSYVNASAAFRSRLVVMALVAWRDAHGRLPSDLSALIGTLLSTMPIDPWDGQPFRYRPAGFPTEVKFPNGTISPGEPALWSAGCLNGVVVRTQDAGGNVFYVLTSGLGSASQWSESSGGSEPPCGCGIMIRIPATPETTEVIR